MSRACSHTSRSFFHGSLCDFVAVRNWNSRSLHSATNSQSCVASVPAAPGSSRSIAWLSQQVIEAFPWETAPRFLLRDRDASYGSVFSKRVAAMGVTEVVTAPRSPWQNAYVERVIGSIRRECLDQVVSDRP